MRKLLTLALTLLLAALPAAAQEDVCVRVGDVTYTTAEVQASLDAQLAQLDDPAALSQEEKDALVQLVLDSFVNTAVLHAKYVEYGLDQMSTADRVVFDRLCEEGYDNLLAVYAQQVMAEYGLTEETARSMAAELLNQYGYTREKVMQARAAALEIDRLATYLGIDTSDTDVDAYYQTDVVVPNKELFESDPENYDMLLQSDVRYVYYMPPQCRRVQQLLLAYPQDAQKQLSELSTQLEETAAAGEQILQDVGSADEETVQALQAQYIALSDKYDELSEQVTRVEAAALETLRPTIEEITRRCLAGEDFAALIQEYEPESQMPAGGYIVRAGSAAWPEGFVENAMLLQTPGELGEAYVSEAGVHLLRYAGDEPEGGVALSAEEQTLLKQQAQSAARDAALQTYLDEWLAQYDIVKNAGALVLP